MKVEMFERVLRFAEPVEAAYGTLRERPLIELTLTGADGVLGRGEAAPLEAYDGVALADVRRALEAYRPLLAAHDGGGGARLLDACRAAADLPQALAAVDMALWDLAGRRGGRPVAALLTDTPATRVPVNATVAAQDRAGAAAAAAAAVRDGYECVKLKVGVGDDPGRVAAVRAALGPEVALRLDANGAWDVEQAVRAIEALAPAGLELVEEPVHGIDAMRRVRERMAVRVAIDETAVEAGALSARIADAVCLKLSSCGGISGTLAAAALVRSSGADVYLSSTYDGPVGIAAALHVAAALGGPGEPGGRASLPACGLATLGLFAELEDPFPARRGAIDVPGAPGLGAL